MKDRQRASMTVLYSLDRRGNGSASGGTECATDVGS